LFPFNVNIKVHVLWLSFEVEIYGLYLNINDKGKGKFLAYVLIFSIKVLFEG